jgi:hypothetical protein
MAESAFSMKADTKPEANIEAVMISPSGGIMVIGWIDDSNLALDYIEIDGVGWHYTFDGAGVARFRRPDVETALATAGPHSYGFFAFAFVGEAIALHGSCEVVLGLCGGGRHTTNYVPRRVDEVALRDLVLTYLAELQTFGNRQVQGLRMLDGAVGQQIIVQNMQITRQIVAGAHVERFARPRGRLKGSIVVCLYGKPEYLFLQSALLRWRSGSSRMREPQSRFTACRKRLSCCQAMLVSVRRTTSRSRMPPATAS